MTPALYKLFWLRANEPELLDRTARVLDVHAFLVHRLTGEWRTSWACADPLGLLDMQSFDWSDEILGEVGLERGQMVELSPPGSVVGELDGGRGQRDGASAGIACGRWRRRRAGRRPRGERDRSGEGVPEPGHGARVWHLQRRLRLGPRVPHPRWSHPEDLRTRDPPSRRHLHHRLVRGQLRRHQTLGPGVWTSAQSKSSRRPPARSLRERRG